MRMIEIYNFDEFCELLELNVKEIEEKIDKINSISDYNFIKDGDDIAVIVKEPEFDDFEDEDDYELGVEDYWNQFNEEVDVARTKNYHYDSTLVVSNNSKRVYSYSK